MLNGLSGLRVKFKMTKVKKKNRTTRASYNFLFMLLLNQNKFELKVFFEKTNQFSLN